MIHRPCTKPGCGAYASPGSSRCDRHQRPGGKQPGRLPDKIRSSSRWQTVRRQHAESHPLCCDPFGVHDGPEPMDSVHHVFPLDTHPELAFTPSNLRSLCDSCHAQIEQRERNGGSTQHLFNATPTQTT